MLLAARAGVAAFRGRVGAKRLLTVMVGTDIAAAGDVTT